MLTVDMKLSLKPCVERYLFLSLLFLGLALLAAWAVGVGEVEGRTLYVDDDAGEAGNGSLEKPFTTIQDSLIPAVDGDRIMVLPGTYQGRVIVNKSVSLEGAGSEITFIEGRRYTPSVNIEADGVSLSGFTMKNGYDSYVSNRDGAITVFSDRNHIFNNNCSYNNDLAGISLHYSHNNIIENNTIWNQNGPGIKLDQSNQNRILNNQFLSKSSYIEDSKRNEVINNRFSTLYLWDSEECKLKDNICDYIGISGSTNCLVLRNSADSGVGKYLSISDSRFLTLHENRFSGAWISIDDETEENLTTHDIAANNTVEGRPFRYHAGVRNKTISAESGLVFLAHCENMTIVNQIGSTKIELYHSPSTRIIDCDLSFSEVHSSSRYSNGIRLFNSNFTTITNSGISGCYYGIRLSDSHNCSISNSSVTNTHESGIYLFRSPDSLITGNEIANNHAYGLVIASHSSGVSVINNTISFNEIGIYSRSNTELVCSNNSISKNLRFGFTATGDTVNATYNWWGSEFGPFDPDNMGNNYGDGNSVKGVNYDPWTGKDDRPDPFNSSQVFVKAGADPAGDGSKEHPFNRILEALYHVRPGGTVLVWEGIYNESLVIEKSVNLIGNDSTKVFVQGSYERDVVRIKANWVNLSKLCINGIFTEDLFDGIVVYSDHNQFSNNSLSSNRHGIYLSGNNITLKGNNCSSNSQAGIYLHYVENCTFLNNSVRDNSDGIFCTNMINCSLSENDVSGNGKGFRFRGNNTVGNHIRNNTIFENLEFGCYNEWGDSVDTSENWWGSIFGPFHLTNNILGGGNYVSDRIIFEPWLGKEKTPPQGTLSEVFVWAEATSKDGDGTREHPVRRIQEGIHLAAAGATIHVWDGYYREVLLVDRNVSLLGNGSDTTIVDGMGLWNVLSIRADSVTVKGFTLTNSSEEDDYPERWKHEVTDGVAGIHIQANFTTIIDCKTTLNDHGILLDQSRGTLLKNNTCTFNREGGIFLQEWCSDNTISTNNCSDNYYFGIRLWNSSWNKIENNNCSSSFPHLDRYQRLRYGIILQEYSWYNDISRNNCNYNCFDGVLLDWNSSQNTITGNNCSYNNDSGVGIRSSSSHNILRDNICCFNGKRGISLGEWTDSIESVCEFNLVESNDCSHNGAHGIGLYEYSKSSIILNNTCWSNDRGVVLYSKGFDLISRNSCEFNRYGIDVGVANSSVEWNVCSNNLASGISSNYGSMYIRNNTCSENRIGIYPRDWNIVENNSCTNNVESGIDLSFANNATVIQNKISGNYNGINFRYALFGNTLENNTITGNVIGINLSSEDDPTVKRSNIIRYNNIYENKEFGLKTTVNKAPLVEANLNWWGSESGPYHPTQNPRGTGDNVSWGVNFTDWLNEDGTVHEPSVFVEEDEGDSMWKRFLVGLLGLSLVFSVAIIISEPLRYALLSLYTRLNPDKIESDIAQQNIRGRIYQFVKDNPGVNLSTIKEEMKLGYGTVVYHLEVLQRERYLRTATAGRRKEFWSKRDFPGLDETGLTDIQRVILEALQKDGPMTRKTLEEKTGLAKSTLGSNIRQLVQAEKLEEQGEGKEKVCSVRLY